MTQRHWTDEEWAVEVARQTQITNELGEEPCYGCGRPAVVVDVNLLDLCHDCADGCRVEATQ